jgi:O-methyltransferase involved in polyketide biosynthesis
LLPEPDRVTYIAKSLLDPSWCKEINTEGGVFMIAEAVLLIFEEPEIKKFFSMLADNFPNGEILFDAPSKPLFTPLGSDLGAWFNMFPQKQRDAMQTALADAMKDWWEKSPQEQKDAVYDMIATLSKWTLEDANEITKWDNRITVIDQFALFRNIPRDSVSADMRQFMDYNDKIRIFNIFHLRV